MMTVYTVIFFITGLIFGSFFNVVGLRVPIGKSVVTPRSHCPTCKRYLHAFELIPVLSYILQRGKCRTCATNISPIYPVMELLTGLLFAYSFSRFHWSFELIEVLFLISMLIILTVSDITYMLIPNKLLLFFFFLFLIVRFVKPLNPWWDSVLGAALGFFVLFLIMIVSRGGMGGGDVKLFSLLGFLLGAKQIMIIFFFSSFFGALYGLMMMIFGQYNRKTAIPFGPFIALGTIFTVFNAESVIQWYMNLLS